MRNLKKTIRCAFDEEYYIGRWYNNKSNWGDAINPILIEKLFGKMIIHQNELYNIVNKPIFSVIGSILNVFNNNKRIVVWGSGVADPNRPMPYTPEKIHAVRGPKTHAYLKGNDIDAPEIFGDPVLLIDRIYQPKNKEKKYKIGIIKHYEDQSPELDEWVNKNINVRFISILRDMSKPFEIIDEILECEMIISSSLHGLILADVYKIPNVWVFFEGHIKDKFKFLDYYESIKKNNKDYILFKNQTLLDLDNLPFEVNKIDLDLDKLFQSNPFTNK
jgi:pyruvyltransferase